MKKKDYIWILFGYSMSIALASTLTLTFYTAYFNGYQVMVYINKINEADLEFIMIIILWIIILKGMIDLIQIIKEVKR